VNNNYGRYNKTLIILDTNIWSNRREEGGDNGNINQFLVSRWQMQTEDS